MDPTAEASIRADRARNARFAALCDRHSGMVFRLSLRLCAGRHAEAEDVAQDSMIAAFRAFPRFAGRARVTTRLYTITVRTWRKRWASQEPVTFPLHDEINRLRITGDDIIGARIAGLTIEAAIAGLSEPLREAIVLVKSEGLTHREAVAVLDLPIGTVQARVHDAPRRLRKVLSEEYPAMALASKAEKVEAKV